MKFLVDKSESGKKRDWRVKKELVELLEGYYNYIEHIEVRNITTGKTRIIDCSKRAKRLSECGKYLTFVKLKNGDELKLVHASFCKLRLCPMCAWRRSLKVFSQVSQIMNAIEQVEPKTRYIFATFTVKNCTANELPEVMQTMLTAYSRKLLHFVEIKKAVKGSFRALEVTYNQKTDTYHPHIHCIFAVSSSYFGDKKYYITHSRWRELWKKAMCLDYDPQVNIKAIKKNEQKNAIAETAKYTVKADDYIMTNNFELSVKVVEVLDRVLYNRRLYAFTGIFAKVQRQLKLDDENGDLVNIGSGDLRNEIVKAIEVYGWVIGIKNYEIKRSVSVMELDLTVGEVVDMLKAKNYDVEGLIIDFEES